ncbi:HAAS domain-containing protein [Sporosarcina pasteurii]|uniref:Uncharacterized membrane-bound protein conserved in bacteria n=1 Tax=Sporosarcina pasteurii TaxID=1474 RepID=A0A380BIV5_SPOPA|nr:DUF1129 family protein [Sporosarcina pasteurii]MDS9470729.1 DUF1129 family protein [Sporosarcina pasteurii]QBQ05593.1 DUF1129 family protein [Sporosarcina pasteurii]SUJ01754.1 Uncharacterized membrane-bound protein conserved in bacteria [Sporosarcina pasteurii]
MNSKLELSNKSRNFLDNLRVYLFSSRKNLGEIEEVMNELEAHLFEAEQNGESIEKVIGKSPKEYMERLSNEMATDNKSWFKYIVLIISGLFSFTIFPDIINLNQSYSVMEIVGHIVFGFTFFFLAFVGLKYTSTMNQSMVKQAMVLLGIVLLLTALFFGLFSLNKVIDSPVIHLGTLGSIVIAVFIVLFFIGVYFWAKK